MRNRSESNERRAHIHRKTTNKQTNNTTNRHTPSDKSLEPLVGCCEFHSLCCVDDLCVEFAGGGLHAVAGHVDLVCLVVRACVFHVL